MLVWVALGMEKWLVSYFYVPMFCGAHDAPGDTDTIQYMTICMWSVNCSSAASMGLMCEVRSMDRASKKQIVNKGHHLLQDYRGNYELWNHVRDLREHGTGIHKAKSDIALSQSWLRSIEGWNEWSRRIHQWDIIWPVCTPTPETPHHEKREHSTITP